MIARDGHTAWHAPQSMQASGSILNGVPEEIAPWGHSPMQAPHDSHLSVIL